MERTLGSDEISHRPLAVWGGSARPVHMHSRCHRCSDSQWAKWQLLFLRTEDPQKLISRVLPILSGPFACWWWAEKQHPHWGVCVDSNSSGTSAMMKFPSGCPFRMSKNYFLHKWTRVHWVRWRQALKVSSRDWDKSCWSLTARFVLGCQHDEPWQPARNRPRPLV